MPAQFLSRHYFLLINSQQKNKTTENQAVLLIKIV